MQRGARRRVPVILASASRSYRAGCVVTRSRRVAAGRRPAAGANSSRAPASGALDFACPPVAEMSGEDLLALYLQAQAKASRATWASLMSVVAPALVALASRRKTPLPGQGRSGSARRWPSTPSPATCGTAPGAARRTSATGGHAMSSSAEAGARDEFAPAVRRRPAATLRERVTHAPRRARTVSQAAGCTARPPEARRCATGTCSARGVLATLQRQALRIAALLRTPGAT